MEREEMMADARAALSSTAVNYVFDELQQEYLNELIQAEVGGLTASTAHASMKVLASVQSRLQSIVNEKLMQARKGR